MTLFKWLLWAVAAVVLLALVAGRLGLLAGRAPASLGVRDGRLKPPSKTPNSVSSQAALWPALGNTDAAIEPLALQGDGKATIERIRDLVVAMPGAKLVEVRDDYLYAQFTSRVLGFVDDTEFWLDPTAQVVQVRSASRVGRKDFGVNRARVERIRAALAASSLPGLSSKP
jgi:uncharacterized protein (DUF1499 family)